MPTLLGITVDGVITDLGPNVFSDGMSYVALSRARKLCNIYLTNFDPHVLLKADKRSWTEYNRLRDGLVWVEYDMVWFGWNFLWMPPLFTRPPVHNNLLQCIKFDYVSRHTDYVSRHTIIYRCVKTLILKIFSNLQKNLD